MILQRNDVLYIIHIFLWIWKTNDTSAQTFNFYIWFWPFTFGFEISLKIVFSGERCRNKNLFCWSEALDRKLSCAFNTEQNSSSQTQKMDTEVDIVVHYNGEARVKI